MGIYVKLCSQSGETHGRTKWGPGVVHEAIGEGKRLCSPDLIHVYDDLILGLMLNPVHAAYKNPRAFEVECEIVANDRGAKKGTKKAAFIRWLEVPEVTTEQRQIFEVLCALEVYTGPEFVAWTKEWLSGTDYPSSAWYAAVEALMRTKGGVDRWPTEPSKRALLAAALAIRCPSILGQWSYGESASAVVSANRFKPLDLVALAHKAMAWQRTPSKS